MAQAEADSSVWYFAIGSMVNPVSLRNRNIFPQESRPAELLDHNIHFFGSIGVAEAVVEQGASFHGVLHQLDAATMEQLDTLERDYVKKTATARCYDGTLIECLVYCRPHSLSMCPDAGTDAVAADAVTKPIIVNRVAAEEAEVELSSPRRSESIFQLGPRSMSLCLSDLRIKESGSEGSPAPKVASVSMHSSLSSHRRLSLENIDIGCFARLPCCLDNGVGDGDEESSSGGGSDNTPTPAKHTSACLDQPPLERYLDIMIEAANILECPRNTLSFSATTKANQDRNLENFIRSASHRRVLRRTRYKKWNNVMDRMDGHSLSRFVEE